MYILNVTPHTISYVLIHRLNCYDEFTIIIELTLETLSYRVERSIL